MSWLHSILKLSSAKIEKRYCDRFFVISKIRISWQDRQGKTRLRRGRVVNISSTGALIKCGTFIPPGSFVYIESAPLGILGGAHIRRCEPLFVTYQIGLQFAGLLESRTC
jgi:hypothetical protein